MKESGARVGSLNTWMDAHREMKEITEQVGRGGTGKFGWSVSSLARLSVTIRR